MKKMILTASLLSILFFAGSALAVDEHHPEKKDAPAATQMNTDQMDTSTQKMGEMRKKIEMEKDPAARKALMQEQMEMMKDCMKMMEGHGTMGGKAMMSGKQDMMGDKSMPMDDRMGMMEKKMKMMQEMMNGMMMQQEMKMK